MNILSSGVVLPTTVIDEGGFGLLIKIVLEGSIPASLIGQWSGFLATPTSAYIDK